MSVWRLTPARSFGGSTTQGLRREEIGWGYCDYPLVDGDRLILAPGGPKATVVALDKRSGEVVWK